MKHKRRRGQPNPLAEYRRVQREIRALFDPFTARHCPACRTPCCVKPARVMPVDVGIAIACGHVFAHLTDPYAPALEYAGYKLTASAITLQMAEQPPAGADFCDYLVGGRCSFPDDLRPFGCTMYLCGPMYAHLPEDELRRMRRLLRQLDEAHSAMLRAIDPPKAEAQVP